MFQLGELLSPWGRGQVTPGVCCSAAKAAVETFPKTRLKAGVRPPARDWSCDDPSRAVIISELLCLPESFCEGA